MQMSLTELLILNSAISYAELRLLLNWNRSLEINVVQLQPKIFEDFFE